MALSSENQFLFSIIVPVFNSERYLAECLQSLQKQSYPMFEAILVDDGSCDNSGILCDQYAQKDSRFMVIHKENGGVTSARTLGALRAKGQYLLFLDSDDYFAPDLLKQLSDAVQQNQSEVVLFNGVRFGGSKQEEIDGFLEAGLYENERIKLIQDHLLYHPAGKVISYGVTMKAFRRDLYLPYQENIPRQLYKGEDLVVSVPCIASCKSVLVVDYCGYFYRDTPNSVMNTYKEQEIDQIKWIAKYLNKNLSASYRNKIDSYLLLHYFDYLDRSMVILRNYAAYQKLIKKTLDQELKSSLKRCYPTKMPLGESVVFFLMRNQLFGVLWIIRTLQRILRRRRA